MDKYDKKMNKFARIKKSLEIGGVILTSLALLFGLVKIVEAPFKLIINNLQDKESAEIILEVKSSFPIIAERPLEFIFGGDVMLSRQVNSKMERYQDYAWPFLKIADFLRQADLTIVNLESPLVVAKDYFVPTGSFSFKANPLAIAGLKLAGVDLVSLANNHSFNQGRAGLEDSFRLLEENEIKYMGAGRSKSEAHQAVVFEIRGEKFAFLAYAYPDDYSLASSESTGMAGMDIEEMVIDVQREKEAGARVIINMHAGLEYVTKPNWQQVDFARAAITAGAEAVIGHHPHWPQTWEIYQGKPIIYSLGNLVFDQMWSLETRQGLLARLVWQDGWQKIELIPVKIYDYGQPEIMTEGAERTNILEKIGVPDSGVIWER